MNAVDRAELLQRALLPGEGTFADARTLEILEHRRRTAVVRRRGWLVRRMLLAADVLGLLVAFAIAQQLFPAAPWSDHLAPLTEALLFVATLPVWIVVAKLYGLYDHDEERTNHATADDLVGVFHLVTVGAWGVFVAGTLSGAVRPELPKLATFWLLAIALIGLGRAAARGLCRRSITYVQNTVVVGAGDVGQLVARKLLRHPEFGINLVGFVDGDPKERPDDLEHLTLLGPPDRLPAIVRLFDVERVVIAFSNDSHEETLELVRLLNEMDVQVDIVPRLYEIVGPGMGIHTVEDLPLVGMPPLRLPRSSRLLKRTVDIVLAAAGLVLLAPLFALIAWRIKVDSPGPVFFRQERMGAGDARFSILKFRTMAVHADRRRDEVDHLNIHGRNGGDGRMFKAVDDPRVTRVGRFLRRYSLDELPQLVNVLRGEMSLVGPRPLVLDEDRHVSDWARKRLDLKPGMTGLWQVAGRNAIPFDEMLRLDLQYVGSWSLWRDVRVLFATIPVILGRVSAGR